MIIVTGGAGFIGSNIVKALNDAGEDKILVVDHLGEGEKWKNLLELSFVDYEHKDDFLIMLERGLFDHGISAVIHMGACSSTTEQNADYLISNNYQYSLFLHKDMQATREFVSFMHRVQLLTATALEDIQMRMMRYHCCAH